MFFFYYVKQMGRIKLAVFIFIGSVKDMILNCRPSIRAFTLLQRLLFDAAKIKTTKNAQDFYFTVV